jgi:hypothetical protein
MNPAHGGRRLALFMALSTEIALGCSAANDHGSVTSSSSASSSSSSSGAGGSGGTRSSEYCSCLGYSAELCTWSGTGGSVSLPDCLVLQTAIFQGTIDGNPYSQTFMGTTGTSDPPLIPGLPPFGLTTVFPGGGYLHIEWGDPNLLGNFWPLTAGELQLPEDGILRTILPGSMARSNCEDYRFQYILVVDGGQLNGCSN